MPRVSFGIATAPQQVTYADIVRVWREADTVSEIEHAWLFDHLMPIASDPGCGQHGDDRPQDDGPQNDAFQREPPPVEPLSSNASDAIIHESAGRVWLLCAPPRERGVTGGATASIGQP